MKLEPILTEKSLKEAKRGNYTFWVGKALTKSQIKRLISEVFAVHVVKVKTANFKEEVKKSLWGRTHRVGARKKATVTLKEKEKIDLFETKK